MARGLYQRCGVQLGALVDMIGCDGQHVSLDRAFIHALSTAGVADPFMLRMYWKTLEFALPLGARPETFTTS